MGIKKDFENLSERLSLAVKLILPLILVIIIIVGLVFFFLILETNRLENRLIRNNALRLQRQLHTILRSQEQQNLMQAALFSEYPPVQAAFRIAHRGNINDENSPASARARQALRRAMQPLMDGFKRSFPEEDYLLHFHLPNGRSLLRVWRKVQRLNGQDISDDISPFRKTVLLVNIQKTPVTGIELGRAGFVIRGLAPVFDADHKHLGSVEVFTRFEPVLNMLAIDQHNDMALLMNRKYLSITTRLDDPQRFPVIANDFIYVLSTNRDFYLQNMDAQMLLSGLEQISNPQRTNDRISYALPIREFSGKPIGTLVYTQSISFFTDFARQIRIAIPLGAVAVILLLGLILYMAARRVSRPLRDISTELMTIDHSAESSSDGKPVDDTRLIAALASIDFERFMSGTREIAILKSALQTMKDSLLDSHTRLVKLNKANELFVPREFLKQLGLEQISDVKLGDQVERKMTILFSDIRDFTSISEKLTPKENFAFINEYLQYMGPVIRKCNGFIDKFIGDAIMALFSQNADDALSAAVEMQQLLQEFNLYRNSRSQIQIGIGIHTGMLMLGTIGDQFRMDGTVISDAVNLAARLESLTKTYGAGIIISNETLMNLRDPSHFTYRFLGRINARGKEISTPIFEVLVPDHNAVSRLKEKTRSDFERALHMFYNAEYNEALQLLDKLAELNEQDKAVQEYRRQIQAML
ncbi:MAG: hypothetical protein KDK39_10870 [Leptospiraceae bacterium]|nr:hypothetical protein [Leptospiraceae bacterium]